MKSKLILSTTIAIFTLASRLIADEVQYPAINPALTYWQSAALAPDLKGEKSALLNDTVSGRKPFDPANTKEILSSSERALKLFARAADSPAPCDWGLPVQDGPEMAIPHVSKMMELSRLAVLKADSLFAEGKTSEGIEWLLTVHRAARHAGAGDLMICVLVQYAIETSAMRAAALHCLGWDDAMRSHYLEGLKALPPMHSLQEALRGESVFADWIERHFRSTDPKTRQALRDELVRANQSNNRPKSESGADTAQLLEQLTPEKGPKLIAELRELNQRIDAAMGKPWKESQGELQALIEEARQGNILVKLSFAESSANLSAKQFEIATLRTMLDAALQYGSKLDEAAAGFKDSFDGEPLVLKKGEDGGLTLTTGRQYRKGKDIELKLGK
jgi:hypothetical protein